MTMPHLMNCRHSPDGWCLDCVKELWDEKDFYENGDIKQCLHDWAETGKTGYMFGEVWKEAKCSKCQAVTRIE